MGAAVKRFIGKSCDTLRWPAPSKSREAPHAVVIFFSLLMWTWVLQVTSVLLSAVSLGTEVAEPALNELAQEEDGDQEAVREKKVINRAFLSLSQITALTEQDVEGVQKKLEEYLKFKQLKTSLKEAILLDYYTAGFCWAKEMNFSLIQLSGFMDLLNFLLENLSDKHMSLGDNIKELGRAMAGIGETDSEGSGDLYFFSIEQAKAVIDYLNISLFKHYKAYEYLFHSPGEEFVISNEYMTELAQPEVPPFPTLLEEEIPSEIYSSFIVSPTATEAESKGSDEEGDWKEPHAEVESCEADAVAGVTDGDQKSAVGEEIPNEIIGNLEAEINEKLQMEEARTL
ncbi:ciliary-associated calcium-binding coiled-coil protein 1 [Patagioenas fasciata]|uniref:ciliary-associated calcium-binding coiled-coil protein 1 n=1 Tax=Patagioenas fasciata TaxID=372321 RepID=UPI003A997265